MAADNFEKWRGIGIEEPAGIRERIWSVGIQKDRQKEISNIHAPLAFHDSGELRGRVDSGLQGVFPCCWINFSCGKAGQELGENKVLQLALDEDMHDAPEQGRRFHLDQMIAKAFGGADGLQCGGGVSLFRS